jgi:pimeloyl-ACP methyl ester carboxylesterase
MDYGAPVGFRIATRHPERVQALIVQNGNAYEEGLRDFWKPIKAYWSDRSETNAAALRHLLTVGATQWQYTNGVQPTRHHQPRQLARGPGALWIAPATRTSNSRCFTTTARIRRSIRSGRNTSADISRPR